MNQSERSYEMPVSCTNPISEKICIQPKMPSRNQAVGFFGHRNLLSQSWDHYVFLHADRYTRKEEVETIISEICGKAYSCILKQR